MRTLKTLGRKSADEVFVEMTDLLEVLGIPYQLTGGIAAKVYGAMRDVNDIDLEVPDADVEELVPFVGKHIVEGPGPHVDQWWDIGALLVLDVRGQLVDISGAQAVRIFDTQSDKGWVDAPVDLETAERHIVCGKEVPVVARAFLMEYKKLLHGDHQRLDVAALERLIADSQ